MLLLYVILKIEDIYLLATYIGEKMWKNSVFSSYNFHKMIETDRNHRSSIIYQRGFYKAKIRKWSLFFTNILILDFYSISILNR